MKKMELVQEIADLKTTMLGYLVLIAYQNWKIKQLKKMYQPATYENGVMVSMARLKFDVPVTSNKVHNIKWYEDKLIENN